ncbi:polysaccharide biosynthesis tyrosine autokinase [Paraburkholderia sp. BL6665CI2N2]|uniref:polysaccharide biosynthesis tyrosine autokinase n=1 Tax=Paraburkholderia sp. BL6665CI2N2 TaxID=1938806 RepID=UPI0010667E4B|nr:polysaccharide biosynthesis tyrosine autokinase [Paraburkholderia sp. BL6665CI2N2]
MNTHIFNAGSSRAGNGAGNFSLRDMLHLLRDHIWILLAFIAGATTLATAYAFLSAPTYSADVVVRVDPPAPPDPNALGISRQDGMAQQQQSTQATAAEVSVMQSRSVLEPVVRQFQFDVEVVPHTFPILGRVAEQFAYPGHPSKPWFGLSSFAWGGETLKIPSLNVPAYLEEKPLVLTALDKGQYELRTPNGDRLLHGETGKPATMPDGLSITVKELAARPGTQFTVTHRNTLDAIDGLRRQLKVAEVTKDTGIVQISFASKDRVLTAQVANAVAQQYITSSISSRQLNDTKTLEFIQGELPRLKRDLTSAEQALSDYQSSTETMRPTTEAQSYLQGSIELQQRTSALQLQRTQAASLFTPNSQQVKTIDAQLAQLAEARRVFDSRFVSMPTSERRNAELTRDAKVAETIYLGMVSKAEELSVRRASATGGAHVVDEALQPYRPLKPNRPLVIVAGCGLGFFIGAFFIVLRRYATTGVTDPLFVERRLDVPVLGEVLFSRQQAQLENETSVQPSQQALSGHDDGAPGLPDPNSLTMEPLDSPSSRAAFSAGLSRAAGARILASRLPHEPSVEALREVRTQVCRDRLNKKNNIVMLTGPSPSTGKSFVAANLSILLTEVGLRVLLIDADMRRGNLASFFKQSNRGGLSEVLQGKLLSTDAVRSVGVRGLSFISCGAYPTNPSELLMMHDFKQVVDQLSEQVDLVIVDTPPFLVVTDAAIMAPHAGATVLVLRSGMQSEDEISETVKKLRRAGGRLLGSVFNAIPKRASNWRSYEQAAQYTRTLTETDEV